MRQLTISLEEEQDEYVKRKLEEDNGLDSQSAVVRDAINRVNVSEKRVEELEQKVERIHSEKRTLIEQRKENQEMQAYVEEQRSLSDGSLTDRLKWLVFGGSD